MKLNRCPSWMIPVLCLIMGFWTVPALAEHNSRVLVLHSYHKGLSWTDAISEGIETTFGKAETSVEIEYAYMDTKRVFNQAYLDQLVELYRVKYKGRSFNAIICSDDHAFNFLLRHGKALFGNTPVVFCGVNFFRDELLAHAPNFTGVIESFDMLTTINTALALQPDATRLVAIGDRTVTGKANKERLQEIIPKLSRPVDVTIVDNLTMREAQAHAGKLSPQDILIWLVFAADRNGEFFSFEESTRMISSHSNAPMYSFWDFNLGHGIVGGMLTSGAMQGRRAAELTLRILHGEAAGNIPVVKKSPNRYMFDYNQLKRFGIKLSRLPAGNLVINQPETFYAEHKQIVWIAISIICAMLTIIVLLLFVLAYRKRVTQELMASKDRFRTVFNQASSGMAVMDLDGAYLQVNGALCQMLGYEERELLKRTWRDITHQGDMAVSQACVEKALRGEFSRPIEKRYLHKDGQDVPVLLNLTAISDAADRPLYLIAQFQDMSQIKAAQAALRERDERYRRYFEGDLSGVYMVTAAGVLIMCNEVFAKMLGFGTSDEVIGTNLIQYYKHPQQRQALVSQLTKDRRLEQYDIELVRNDGQTIQCLVNAVGHFGFPLFGRPFRVRPDRCSASPGRYTGLSRNAANTYGVCPKASPP